MLLSVQNLRKHFNGVQALAGVCFAVGDGERLGIIGPNGSGKSTLEGCIGGSIEADEGEIRIGSIGLRNMPPEERLRLGIARMFQVPQFVADESVAMNVWMGSYCTTWWAQRLGRVDASRSQIVREALGFVGLSSDASSAASKLSYFNKRRMELARALVSKPCLLLLDEPTSGMTPEERTYFESLLLQLKNIAIVLVEHEWHAIRHVCERVLIMQAGRVVAERVAGDLALDDEVRGLFEGTITNAMRT